MRLSLFLLHVVLVLLGCNKKAAPENAPPPKESKSSNDSQTGGQDADLKNRLAGKWFPEGVSQEDSEAEDCFCGKCLDIQFDKIDDSFCVESNQIFVSAYYRLDAANKKVNLYFKRPTDLGSGGASLPWNDFDRTKPIAVIDASSLDKNTLKVDWLGFVTKSKPADTQSYGDFGSDYEGIYHKQAAQ